MTYYYQHTDLIIYKAAIYDDWERAKTIFQECPTLRSKPINVRLETPLMIAVGTNCSDNFVRGLMFLINPDSDDRHSELYDKNDKGYTALHCAVEKDMILFLRENTLVQTQSYERVGTSILPVSDGNLITLTIQAGLLAPALKNISEIKENIMTCNRKRRSGHYLEYFRTCNSYNIYELIEECILAYLGIIWYRFEGFNLFHLAIKERQVQVFNLVYQMSSYKTFAASELHEEEQENALRIAAKLAQPHRLNIVTGAALQMKCELRWIKVFF
ncbi:ankyrin repeat-containing domain, PGG domain protein [Tanacetum coccineum]